MYSTRCRGHPIYPGSINSKAEARFQTHVCCIISGELLQTARPCIILLCSNRYLTTFGVASCVDRRDACARRQYCEPLCTKPDLLSAPFSSSLLHQRAAPRHIRLEGCGRQRQSGQRTLQRLPRRGEGAQSSSSPPMKQWPMFRAGRPS